MEPNGRSIRSVSTPRDPVCESKPTTNSGAVSAGNFAQQRNASKGAEGNQVRGRSAAPATPSKGGYAYLYTKLASVVRFAAGLVVIAVWAALSAAALIWAVRSSYGGGPDWLPVFFCLLILPLGFRR